MSGFRIALAAAGAVISPAAPGDTGTPITPFFTTNQSPVIQVHALPALDNARLLAAGQTRYRLVNSLASNYTRRQRGNETVFFDGETLRSTFIYSRGIGGDVEWQLHIPYVDNSGGSLDSFIVDWHNTFGLPQGGRNETPNTQFEYRYQQDSVT
ncbi:MAG: DUF3187 family protein, partial [Gammaproteobacteria bacterium]|nr:DUF3187 family protein [Gammaproteobacteria bacterium]